MIVTPNLSALKFIVILTCIFAFSEKIHAQKINPTPLNSENFIDRNASINNTLYRIKKEKKATVAFMGGSITHMKGWKEMVSNYLVTAFPDTKFTFIEAAIPSLGSVAHSFRLNTDLLDKGSIDLLFFESAVNDSGTKEQTQRRAIEGVLRRAYEVNPFLNIIMMAFVDGGKLTEFNKGNIPLEVKVHQDLAKQYGLPFINLAAEVNQRINNNEFIWKDDFKNMHPSPFGHEVYFRTIKTLLEKELSGTVPVKLFAVKLPVANDLFNYSKADYVNISKAEHLNGFSFVNNWQPSDGMKGRSGFVNIPVLEGLSAGSSFEFTFKGRTVGIGCITGPDAGKIKFSIDGQTEGTADIYINASKSLHFPYYLVLGDSLSPGKHTIKLWIDSNTTSKPKGTACRVAYFLVNK